MDKLDHLKRGKSYNFGNQLISCYLDNEEKALVLQKHYIENNELNNPELPLVSVLIPAYNSELYIKTSILSTLYQSYNKIEIIVIDDGSIDNTKQIIQDLMCIHSNIKLIVNEKNEGLVYSLNRGIEVCNGEYIARMDADDINLPNRIEDQYFMLLNNKDIVAVCSWMIKFSKDKHKSILEYSDDNEILKTNLFFYCPLPHPTSMFRSSVLKNLKYRNEYQIGEDYDLWRRILKDSKVGVIQRPLLLYRFHENQFTATRNTDKIKFHFSKIASDIFTDIGMEFSKEELEFHVEYLMLNRDIKDKIVFLKLDLWLNKIISNLNSSGYINTSIFINHVFKNRWIDKYNLFKYDFSINQRLTLIKSKMNRLGFKQQLRHTLSKP